MFNYRIHPSGKSLESKLEKARVKNNYLSKLIITNVQLFDSGIYRLAVNNGVLSKEIEVTLFVEGKIKIKICLC